MKIAFLSVAALILVAGFGYRMSQFDESSSTTISDGELSWETDYAAAVAQAKEENKRLLINFTGSDWCGWCKKLDREVFSQPTFIDFANDNLVCVKLDFPRSFRLSDEERKQNNTLARKHGVRGYPTILILDATENTLLRTGYKRGGVENYIRHLQPYMAKK